MNPNFAMVTVAIGDYVRYGGYLYLVTECDAEPRLHPLTYGGLRVMDFEIEQGDQVSIDLEDAGVVVLSTDQFNQL